MLPLLSALRLSDDSQPPTAPKQGRILLDDDSTDSEDDNVLSKRPPKNQKKGVVPAVVVVPPVPALPTMPVPAVPIQPGGVLPGMVVQPAVPMPMVPAVPAVTMPPPPPPDPMDILSDGHVDFKGKHHYVGKFYDSKKMTNGFGKTVVRGSLVLDNKLDVYKILELYDIRIHAGVKKLSGSAPIGPLIPPASIAKVTLLGKWRDSDFESGTVMIECNSWDAITQLHLIVDDFTVIQKVHLFFQSTTTSIAKFSAIWEWSDTTASTGVSLLDANGSLTSGTDSQIACEIRVLEQGKPGFLGATFISKYKMGPSGAVCSDTRAVMVLNPEYAKYTPYFTTHKYLFMQLGQALFSIRDLDTSPFHATLLSDAFSKGHLIKYEGGVNNGGIGSSFDGKGVLRESTKDDYSYVKTTAKFDTDLSGANDEKATIVYSNGWMFVGRLKKSMREGSGVLTAPSGAEWHGTWTQNLRTDDPGKLVLDGGNRTVKGWWPQGKAFVDTVARSREHAVSLKDRVYNYLTNRLGRTINPEYANFERILVQLPNHDRIVARTDEIVLRPVDNVTLASIEQLFLATNPEQLGVGQDTAHYMRFGETYNQVKPIAAFDVDYSKSKVQRQWERSQATHETRMAYCITADKDSSSKERYEKDRAGDWASGLKKGPRGASEQSREDPRFVHTRTDRLPGLAHDVPLDKDINESFFLHGTPSSNVLPMLMQGPTNAYAKRGRFGAAAYFAEDVGKSDQYCKLELDGSKHNIDMDKGDNGEIKKMLGITPDMYADAAVSAAGNKDVFYMFVVRVALGCPARVRANDYDQNKAGKPGTDAYTSGKLMHDGSAGTMGYAKKLDRQFQSVIVDEWGYNAAPNLRFREFMVYNNGVGMVAKITHIVAYKRMQGAAAGVKYGSAFEDPLSIKWPDHTVAPPWERPAVSALLTSTELPVDELSEMDMHTLEEPPAVATPPPAAAAAASSSGGGLPPSSTGAKYYKNILSFPSGGKVDWTIRIDDTKHPLLPTTSVAVWNGVIGNIKHNSYAGVSLYSPSKTKERVLLSKLRLMLLTPGSMALTKKNMDFYALVSFLVVSPGWKDWSTIFAGASRTSWLSVKGNKVSGLFDLSSFPMTLKEVNNMCDTAVLRAYITQDKANDAKLEEMIPALATYVFPKPPDRIVSNRLAFHGAMKRMYYLFAEKGLVLNSATTGADLSSLVV